jgi:alanine dehydrogenase
VTCRAAGRFVPTAEGTGRMTLILARKDVEQLLTMEMAMEAVEEAFLEDGRGTTQVPERIALWFEDLHGVIGVMPGYLKGLQAAGVKIICHHEQNRAKYNLPATAGLVVYHNPLTGMPLAIMDCAYITRMRTGAATGVSAKYLARADAKTLGIVGAGAIALPQVAAIAKVRELSSVRVYDLDDEASARLVAALKDMGMQAEAVASARDACRGVDILVTCTPARSALIQGDWVEEGMHIAAVGADMPHKRELDSDVYARADKWVTDLVKQALITGEIAQALADGAISEDSLHATLGEIAAGQKKGRENNAEITIFKSTGMAIQDVATAKKVYELARDKGLGVEVSITP